MQTKIQVQGPSLQNHLVRYVWENWKICPTQTPVAISFVSSVWWNGPRLNPYVLFVKDKLAVLFTTFVMAIQKGISFRLHHHEKTETFLSKLIVLIILKSYEDSNMVVVLQILTR